MITRATKLSKMLEMAAGAAPVVGKGTLLKDASGIKAGTLVQYVIAKSHIRVSPIVGTPKYVEVVGDINDIIGNPVPLDTDPSLKSVDADFAKRK